MLYVEDGEERADCLDATVATVSQVRGDTRASLCSDRAGRSAVLLCRAVDAVTGCSVAVTGAATVIHANDDTEYTGRCTHKVCPLLLSSPHKEEGFSSPAELS